MQIRVQRRLRPDQLVGVKNGFQKKSAQRVRRSLSADTKENSSTAYMVVLYSTRALLYNSPGKDIPGFGK